MKRIRQLVIMARARVRASERQSVHYIRFGSTEREREREQRGVRSAPDQFWTQTVLN